MMRRFSLEDHLSLFYRAAAICAHANYFKSGFRQRDFVFFLDLVLNWASLPKEQQVRIHNAQSLRFLAQLVEDGFCKRSNKGKTPHYRLTRLGLLELVTLMVHSSERLNFQEFYFLFYFVSSYRTRIESLIAAEGQQFPVALKLEILGLLNPEELLRAELRKCDQEIEKLEIRIRETQTGTRFYEDKRRQGHSVVDSARLLEERFPYALNSQKPLSKLIGEIPADIAEIELTSSAKRRTEILFQPARQLLLKHRENLRQLTI
jgi:hypothetical protein